MSSEKDAQDERAVLISQLVEVDELHLNISQQVIVTTQDKLELCLNKYLKKSEKKKEWLTPFGLLVAIVIVFVSANFKEFIFAKETWEAIFIILGIGSFFWFTITIKNAFNSIDVKNIIEELKLGEKNRSTQKNTIGDDVQ